MEDNQVIDNVSAPIETPEEKIFSQKELDKIVWHEKAKVQAAKRELEERHQRELQELASKQQQQTEHENVPHGLDTDAIYQQLQERFNQDMQQRQFKSEMEKVANSYLSKMAEGKKAYEDFDEVSKKFDPASYPHLVLLLANMPDAEHVIYELSKNPSKRVLLGLMAKEEPDEAQAELLKLSNSITQNRQAKAEEGSYSVSEPLDRLQNSRISGSNDKMSVRDLRNQPWLKG